MGELIANHLRPLVGNVLGEHCQEIHGIKHFEVAVDLGIEPRAVDHRVPRLFQGDLGRGERVAQDVLAKFLPLGAILRGHTAGGVHVESGVLPAAHALHQLRGDPPQPKEFGEDPVAKEGFQNAVRDLGSGVPLALRIEETLGNQGMDVGVEVEVLAKGVEGEEEGGSS